MRAAATVLLFVVHAASALQPVSVQRRAVLGGAAAALVAAPQKNNAAGLEQFKTLVDELAALNKAAQTGKATTKTLQKGFVTTVVPLENAARKNPSRAAPGSNLGGRETAQRPRIQQISSRRTGTTPSTSTASSSRRRSPPTPPNSKPRARRKTRRRSSRSSSSRRTRTARRSTARIY